MIIKDRAWLHTFSPAAELQVNDMKPAVLWNVSRGSWYNLISRRDASRIIVENQETHLHETEISQMTESEMSRVQVLLQDGTTHRYNRPMFAAGSYYQEKRTQ